jgi:hypothetical protein
MANEAKPVTRYFLLILALWIVKAIVYAFRREMFEDNFREYMEAVKRELWELEKF